MNDPNNPGEACFFSDKIRAGEEAGYDVVLVANHHAGAQGGETPLRPSSAAARAAPCSARPPACASVMSHA